MGLCLRMVMFLMVKVVALLVRVEAERSRSPPSKRGLEGELEVRAAGDPEG